MPLPCRVIVQTGERALLIYPSGLEFYCCLLLVVSLNGINAVPVYPPSASRSDRTLTKFRRIVSDVQTASVYDDDCPVGKS